MGTDDGPIRRPPAAAPAAHARDGFGRGRSTDRSIGGSRTRHALIGRGLLAALALVGALHAQDEAAANAAFDEQFGTGYEALRRGETSKAWRAFTRCRERVEAMSLERRAEAAFVADLFLIETRFRVGKTEDAVLFSDLLNLADAARTSGAWTAERWERYRLRAILLLWRTAPPGNSASAMVEADRRWLLREDFFENASAARPLHDDARVMRLRLSQGTDRELPMLQELVAAEQGHARRSARGEESTADEREGRTSILDALATYHAQRRNFDRAQVYADRLPAEESVALRGWLALQREDHVLAEACARRLLDSRPEVGHQMLAEALEAGGDPERALPHYEKVLSGQQDAASRAAAQNGLGDCLLTLGREAEARSAYEAALRLSQDSTFGAMAERAETRKDLGRLAERLGDPGEALRHYLDALAIGEETRARLLDDPFGGSWLRVHGDQTTAIDGVLRTWQGAGGEAWDVMYALELGRARGALDLISGRGKTVDAGQLRQLVMARLCPEDEAEAEQAAAGLDALRAHFASVVAPVHVPGSAELREFAERHAATTILSWWLGREQAWLLLVRGDRVRQFELSEPEVCRRRVLAAWFAVRSAEGDPAALRDAADCLVPAAARAVLGEDVLAVLDPTMARLPLAALEIDGQPFGLRHRLVQAPSLAVARALENRQTSDERTLVVEAPERTELTDRLGLDPLKFAARECAAVLAAHGSSWHLRGTAGATLRRLEEELPRSSSAGSTPREGPSVLHVAAHAVDCAGLPTQSLLLLADGPLAMAGLRGVMLEGTLVVLSACAAATGEQRGHEGVVGLVEGALATGARGVVAPVAPVNQQATADFMRLFHDALGRGADAASALRAARETMAATDNYAHPHYWGSFTLFAAPAEAVLAAPPARRAWWPFAIGALILVGAGMWLLRRTSPRTGATSAGPSPGRDASRAED